MGKKGGDAPRAPDPRVTAEAQQGLNLSTALTQQQLNNVNQVTPYGNLSYNQTGTNQMTDPLTGKLITIPKYTATQTLSPQQQALMNSQNKAALTGSNLANQQLNKLGGILGTNVNMGNAPKVNAPQMSQFGPGPQMQTGFGYAGNIDKTISSGGKIANGFGQAGSIQRGVDDAGAVRNTITAAGDITKTYGDEAGYAQQRQKVEDTLMARMNPSLEQERGRLSSQLANQGIKQGTEAYDRAMQNYGQQTNDARYGAILNAGQEQSRLAGLDQNRAQFQNSAQAQNFDQNTTRAQFLNQAQAQRYGQNANDMQLGNAAQAQQYGQLRDRAAFGNEAQAQRFGQNAAQSAFRNAGQQQAYDQFQGRAAFGNDARQQMYGNQTAATGMNNQLAQQQFGNQQSMRSNYLQEQYTGRNQPINEIAALLGTGQVQSPNFVNTPQSSMANTDYAGMVQQNYSNQMQQWQQKQQNNPMNGIMGGLFSLGSSAIMASDRRLKTDVSFLGWLRDLPIWSYRYIWGGPMRVGVMAQDMLKLRPASVVVMPNGFLAVDYGAL